MTGFFLNIQIILKIYLYLLYSFDTKFNDMQRWMERWIPRVNSMTNGKCVLMYIFLLFRILNTNVSISSYHFNIHLLLYYNISYWCQLNIRQEFKQDGFLNGKGVIIDMMVPWHTFPNTDCYYKDKEYLEIHLTKGQ